MKVLLFVLALILAIQETSGQTNVNAFSDSARAYLEKAISIMEGSAYYRGRVNWAMTRDSCMSLSRGAQTPADTYDAIRYAIRCLEDHHSGFRTPEQMKRYSTRTVQENPRPEVALVAKGIGYILMPGFGSLDGTQMLMYVSDLDARLDSVARTGVRGWVLDLRKNTGGNMWPMLASLLWFLPADTLGCFINRDGARYIWPRWGLAGTPPPVDGALASTFADAPMAVLQGDTTASSGEAVLIAVKSRANTCTIGRPTSGRSSANGFFWLSDGATIVLTTQLFGDRIGNVYGGPIQPDVPNTSTSESQDPELAAALSWLRERIR
jgi:carboxyl-terminal processing protease